MRKIDESKKERITDAVYHIVRTEGLSALSFGKIAKMAEVSPGTPYVYYADKTDMLSKIYLEAKRKLDEGIKEDIASAPSTEEKIFQCVYHFAVKFHEYPLDGFYLLTMCNNLSILSSEAVREADRMSKPIYDVYRQAVDEERWKDDKLDHIIPLLYGPMIMSIDMKIKSETKWMPQEMEPIIRMSMQAVLR